MAERLVTAEDLDPLRTWCECGAVERCSCEGRTDADRLATLDAIVRREAAKALTHAADKIHGGTPPRSVVPQAYIDGRDAAEALVRRCAKEVARDG